MKNKFVHILVALVLTFLISSTLLAQRVRVGAEILLEKHLDLLQGKRVGVICNHTSILPNTTHLIDTLIARGITVTALFSPEHGIRGATPHGVKVEDTVDAKTGLKLYSLYGKRRKPTAEMLTNVDVMLFDMQDVGARFYTYYITMSYAMESAAEYNKTFIVLDRPNPINGIDIEGPILDSLFQSGVGRFSLPIRHGMTIGEIAKMIVGEEWLGKHYKFTLHVIPMEGWMRSMWYDDTKLSWIPPSPNMKFLSTAIVYPGTCLFEATNLSEGRGAFKPFEYVGAPWIDGKKISQQMNGLKLPGVRFHPIIFTPEADSIHAPNPKYNGELCQGIFIQVTNRNIYRPVTTALMMIEIIRTLYPSQFTVDAKTFDRVLGTDTFRILLEQRTTVDSLIPVWSKQDDDFRQKRAKYLLY